MASSRTTDAARIGTLHRKMDAVPPALPSVTNGRGTPTDSARRGSIPGIYFEVDFDPNRDYLRELKNEKESQKGRRVQAFNADGDWILDDSRLRIVRIV